MRLVAIVPMANLYSTDVCMMSLIRYLWMAVILHDDESSLLHLPSLTVLHLVSSRYP
jgi:hypothetical protein